MRARAAIVGVGLVVGAYGAWLLLRAGSERGWGELLDVAVWLLAGVVVHDALLAPLVVVLGAVGVGLLPRRWRGVAAGAALVWGSVTLLAVPVLGRFGARADNPTLLDRPYLLGWLGFTAVVVVAAVIAARRDPQEGGGSSTPRATR